MATAETLQEQLPTLELHFVGTVDGYERELVTNYGIALSAYSEIRAGPWHGLPWSKKIRSVGQLLIGLIQALVLLARQRPKAILLTGGWMGFPVALAAWFWRVPTMIYLPDIEPGLAIKALAPFVKRIAIHVPQSACFFPRREVRVVGYPLRRNFRRASRDTGIKQLGLSAERRTLLIMGGSLGARSLNQALQRILSDLILDGWQVLHITGTANWSMVSGEESTSLEHYHPFPYLEEIGLALAAADLVVSRAGASVLAEYPYHGTPSILIPLARTWRYQQVNAEYLRENGAAVILPEEQVIEGLLTAIRQLVGGDGQNLLWMRAKARSLATRGGEEKLAKAVLEMIA